VYLSRTALVVNAQAIARVPPHFERGFHDRPGVKGRQDFLLPALDEVVSQASTSRHSPGTIAVLADGSTPYRPLMEVLLTLLRERYSSVQLVGQGRDGPVGVKVYAPTAVTPEDCSPESSDPRVPGVRHWTSVTLLGDGVRLLSGGNTIRGGCDPDGPGFGLPMSGGDYDYDALERCLVSLRQGQRACATSDAWFSASEEVPLDRVMRALDVLRAAGFGRPHFSFPLSAWAHEPVR
jgi:biopolymer transport protein ExbD